MNKIRHGNITTQKIIKNVWIAKTTTLEPLKAQFEMQGNSETNAYEKLLCFLKSDESPETTEILPNGNKIYHFKKNNYEIIDKI